MSECAKRRCMRHEEERLLACAARRCGAALVVPVVRVVASSVGAVAYTAEAQAVGLLIRDAHGVRWTPLVPLPDDVSSWDAWLAARPTLVAELRARLEAGDESGC